MTVFILLLAISTGVIEEHYNSAKTLMSVFEQTYVTGGRKRVEMGTLTLRKPGKMRWDYDNGKIFVTDGKKVWFYQPSANRVEVSKVKESDDLRAPLAFLLGRLDFSKLFREVREENGEIVAIPKSDQAPYREVRFTTLADGTIEHVRVTGQDASVMEFVFSQERRNLPVNDATFRFTPPAGAEVVEVKVEP